MAALLTLKKNSITSWRKTRTTETLLYKDVCDAIRVAVKEGARQKKACELAGITPRTLQNWRRVGFDKHKGACKRILRKLDIKEREEILEVCNSERFRDMNPHQIVPIPAREEKYLASKSTIYRVLRMIGKVMRFHKGCSAGYHKNEI